MAEVSPQGSPQFVVGPDDDPDKYRLRRQIGGGGEAELWEADVALAGERERVAVKILRPEFAGDPAWRERWAEQVELLRLIQHPAIVGVHDQFEGARMHAPGRAGERPERALYLVMNWVDGQDLRTWVPQHRDPGDLPEALRLLTQVAGVLDWLHSGSATPSGRPVVHGDISPANVVVNRDGQAVLVDFGLSRVVGHVTQTRAGTRGYCAPEVVDRGEYSPASDRYAFGGLAYYLLTGEHPEPDPQRLREGLARVEALTEQPVDIDELTTIFAADPAQRPSATQWLGLLRRQTSTSSALAVPLRGSSAAGARRRWRSPWLAAAASGVLVLAVVAAVAFGAGLLPPAQTGAGADDADGAAGSPAPPPEPAAPPPAQSPPAPPSTPPAPTSPPAPSPWPGEPTGTTYIVGNVILQSCDIACDRHVDLDGNRTTIFDERQDTDFTGTEDGIGAQGQAQLAPWSGEDQPTLAGCRELPDDQWLVPFIPAEQFEEPSSYCIWTTAGRYGYLQTQRIDGYDYYFYYLLWLRPDD